MADTITIEISAELRQRIEAIAARCEWTPEQVLAAVVERGESLAWQEYYLDSVEAGLAAADRGEFLSDEELEAILNR